MDSKQKTVARGRVHLILDLPRLPGPIVLSVASMNLRRLTPCLAALSLVLGWSMASAEEPAPKTKPGYKVEVELKVKEDGSVEDAKIVKTEDTSGDALLDRAALAGLMRHKMPVREKDGHPIAYTAIAPVVFPVPDDEGPESNNAPKPKIHSAPQIAYPPGLAEQGVVGGAILELIIGADGNVSSVKVLRSSHPEFAKAAEDGVKRWTFIPAMKDNQPVESRWRLAVTFATDKEDADWPWRIAPRPSLGNYTVARRMTTADQPAPAATPEPEKK
jgi:TonB family protein